MKTILIIGGYGNAGRQIAQLLLERREDVQVWIAGRDLRKAELFATDLNCRIGQPRASARALDIANRDSLDGVFPQADFVINAAPGIDQSEIVLEALLHWGKDGMDTQLSSPDKWKALDKIAPLFVEKGLTYIADGGFHPGVPAAMVRYAAAQMDVLEAADIYSVMKINWKGLSFSRETLDEFVAEFKYFKPLVFQDGAWKRLPSWKTYPFTFDPPFGRQATVPMHLREMEELPRQIPSLRQTGFFVAGFNPLTDWVLTPLVLLGINAFPTRFQLPFTRLFHWGLKQTKGPFGILLTADCAGKTDGLPALFRMTLFQEDAYLLTAAPVVACVEQYLDGAIWQEGIQDQGNAVDPETFFKAIGEMGIQIRESSGSKVPFSMH